MTVFDTIRESCARVSARARHVRINDFKIPDMGESLSRDPDPGLKTSPCGGSQGGEGSDPARTYRGNIKDTVDFVCFLNAANFGSGYRDELWREHSLPDTKRFYSALMGALDAYVSDHGIPDMSDIVDSDIRLYAEIFDLPPDNQAARNLLGLFEKSYKDYARFLLDNHNGSAYKLYLSSNKSAQKLVSELIKIPSYQDIATYKSTPVYFYKRAQITAADLFFALENEEEVFTDINHLTAFADPALPQMLRYYGILEYSDDLSGRIQKGDELAPGSPEEVEIRAATVQAIEKIKGYHPFWRVIDIDDILWRRAGTIDLSKFPRHKTKTIFY